MIILVSAWVYTAIGLLMLVALLHQLGRMRK